MVRLLNVSVARTHGVFDDLHGHPDGRTMADRLRTTAGRHYGHAGPEFVRRLIEETRDLGGLQAEIEALPAFLASDSQEGRAASGFAVFGLAGELAVEYGILPWPTGEALKAAAEMYRVWRAGRGSGMTEDRQILQAVADFISRHGDSRFSAKGDTTTIVRDRAGWWTDGIDGRVYLFTSGGLREATNGYDFARVLAALDAAGWIVARDDSGRARSRTVDVGGGRKPRLYWIMPEEIDV
jgi:putative DNA primase/helicase